eukprot:8848250-Pyramimonas_sp.AAC.1
MLQMAARVPVVMLSIDVANSPDRGDLTVEASGRPSELLEGPHARPGPRAVRIHRLMGVMLGNRLLQTMLQV